MQLVINLRCVNLISFAPNKNLFPSVDEEQIIGLDILYYKMLKVSLSALVSNVSDSLVPVNINYMYTVLVKQFLSFFKEQMIKAVYLYVRRSASSQNHLVILDILNQKCETVCKLLNCWYCF